MIDLHIHSKYSDGSYDVKEILNDAERRKLKTISITDHDSINAHIEIRDNDYSHLFSGKIINGVEITTTYQGEVIEILAYNFDIDKMKEFLQNNTSDLYTQRTKEYNLIINNYTNLGVKFFEEDLPLNLDISPKRAILNAICKHFENDNFYLVKESKTNFTSFIRNEVYNPKSKLYVDYSSIFPSLDLVIKSIHDFGGTAILAHPYIYSTNIIDNIDCILNTYQIDGLECFYPAFNKKQTKFLINIAKKRSLVISGGTDFHGAVRPNIEIGIGNGKFKIPKKISKFWTKNQ